ncbi:MAG: insulinase family protein [Bacteroidetes bacterium]|nr:insulinase family protein [Bacteroidota bacterium]MCL2303361.1 insulinase family protein [Lentimicrobiaceae bacterium]
MKKATLSLLVALFATFSVLQAQKQYKYETVPNDPLNARIYTLDNGLIVFLTQYREAPRIQAYIPVKVGSKNDPAETTGLAHYFEHMMFKGSADFGTIDWEKEQVMIAQIEELFEQYRVLTDESERAALYRIIDSVSYEASKLTIPNEYDKAMKFIGSQGTNAATSNDYTFYMENIPSNQLENWAIIQANRFDHPVLRLFHTELETVYEEKNMSLTNDNRKAIEAILAGLFPNHPYGNQTTLGEAEHLKNPSMKNIREFYDQYYVANNMAIILSGDFEFDDAIAIIDKHFNKLRSGNIPELIYTGESPITQPVIKEVVGLDAEFINMAFRVDLPANHPDIYILNMLTRVLFNGKSGLIDLNLNQKQAVMSAGAAAYVLTDNAALFLTGKPKEGQTLEEVRDLLLQQIDLLKQGKFSDDLLIAVINNMRLQEMRQLESNASRGRMLMSAFWNDVPWAVASQSIANYSKITKKNIVDFANKHFHDNYVIVYKRQGTPEEVAKVNKPAITPIHINRDAESDFMLKLKENKVEPIQPVFIDFKKDMTIIPNKNFNIYYIENVENATFNLQFRYKIGELNDLRLPFAADYISYLGTSKMSADKIQEEFYKLACNMNLSCSDEYTTLTISGLTDNFAKALQLTLSVMKDAQPNAEALQNLVSNALKARRDAKSNQNAVQSALRSYGEFGPGLAKHLLSEEQLQKLTPNEMINLIKDLLNIKPEIYFYGNLSADEFNKLLLKDYKTPKKFIEPATAKVFNRVEVSEDKVYFVHYDAKQARLFTYSDGTPFSVQKLPNINMYNQYFGGSMNAIVFQEMREKRSLAYTAQSRYMSANEIGKNNYNFSFIATQNDKVADAFEAFNELFNDMPQSEAAFKLANEAALQSIETNRIQKIAIFNAWRNAQRMGIDYDINKILYEAYKTLTLDDVVKFNHNHIKDRKKVYMISAKESDMNFEELQNKFGPVKKLTLEDIFGY